MEIKEIGRGFLEAGLAAVAGWYLGVAVDSLANIAHVAIQFGTSNAPLVLAFVGGVIGVISLLEE